MPFTNNNKNTKGLDSTLVDDICWLVWKGIIFTSKGYYDENVSFFFSRLL